MSDREDSGIGKDPPQLLVEELLKNPFRKKIIDLLENQPGMNKNQLAKKLGININGIEFHLQRMERTGLVETRRAPKGRETVCFTPKNAKLWDNESTRVLFGRGSPRAVAQHLAQNPGASVKQIARSLNLPENTVRRHMRVLVESELAQKLRVQKKVIYHAEPDLTKWLDEMSYKTNGSQMTAGD